MKSARQPPKRGTKRPAGGYDPPISARIPQHLRDAVYVWARRRGIPKSLAIRRLIEQGLKK